MRIALGRLFFLARSDFYPTYIAGAKGGKCLSGVAMLGGNSLCMDNFLGDGGFIWGRCSSTYFRLHALGGGSLVLSLQLLEGKQHLGGEDYNVPILAHG